MARIIEIEKSIVLSPDVEPEAYPGLMAQMEGVEGLGGVKLGFGLGLGMGLKNSVDIGREANPKLKFIYDHQKAGNDIPETGSLFAKTMERADVDGAILFPFTGPKTQEFWTRELQQVGVEVIVGSRMTHPEMSESDGGYIMDSAFGRIFGMAIQMDVTNFVVPGNQPDAVAEFKELFDKEIGEGGYTLWAPGFVSQNGDITETGQVAGPNWHAIVGSGIYKQADPGAAATALGGKMLALNDQGV